MLSRLVSSLFAKSILCSLTLMEANASYLLGNSTFYEIAEEKHSTITNFIFKTTCYTIFISYGVVAMAPLLYVLFGYPEPNHWIIPFGLP